MTTAYQTEIDWTHGHDGKLLTPTLRMARPQVDPAPQAGRLTTREQILNFVLAGNATFTIRNARTGNRFTYKVRQPKKDAPHFVGLLAGPDNEADYQFLGSIFDGVRYCHGRRSAVSPSAQSAMAFAAFWGLVVSDRLPANLEVWHEGSCGKCGRKLTVPESIEAGLGPECARRGL